MNQQNENYVPESDEIDLRPIIRKLWNGKWIILGMVAASLVAGAVYYKTATRWYQASVVLLPRDTKGSAGGISAQLGQLGGLASLAGISLGAPGREEPLAILRSKGFARRFVEEYHIDHEIFNSQWDSAAGKWKAGSDPDEHDIRDAVDDFQKKLLTINEDKKTGLVTLTTKSRSAALASKWANRFAQKINDEMRAKALKESQKTIDYLTGEIEKSTVLSVREAQARLLENELQKLTLAGGTTEYAYRVIDEAYAPKKHVKPWFPLVIFLAMSAGAAVGILVVFIRGREGGSHDEKARQ